MHRPSNETESGVDSETDAANREGNIAYRRTGCRTCPIFQDSRREAFTVVYQFPTTRSTGEKPRVRGLTVEAMKRHLICFKTNGSYAMEVSRQTGEKHLWMVLMQMEDLAGRPTSLLRG
ncbi:hypothetical protein RRG08_057353 [Elysia crispata]|uniref:Uncharacterized protein n=1 Tax=Elysia crispata TaxID=231223 RepID=A0AAE1CZU0_9GAST|nr:hypothetical protein RRG08_057353 [Elysia crispata]